MSNKYFKKTLTEIFADLPYRCIEHSKIHGNYPNIVIDGWSSDSMVLGLEGFADTFDEAMHKKNTEYRTNMRIYNTKPVKSKNDSKRIDYIFTYPGERVAVSNNDSV